MKNRLLYFKVLFYGLLSIVYLHANDVQLSDCLSNNAEEEMGCSIASILEKQPPIFRIREEKPLPKKTSNELVLKITKTLTQIRVRHEDKELLIQRTTKKRNHTCPPFCIQPMNIEKVKSVGELEVLEFIKVLKKKKSKLLIDARSNTRYRTHTIPGAINIPFTMLKDGNRYQKKVLTLLGAKQHSNQWDFSKVPTLLIFGHSDEESQANQAIKSLLKLSYPANRILYYRGGLSAWKRLGLTLY